MTVTLAFRFPWGRYYATPWGRPMNDGAVELPPSPWRLLRALYAVWHTRAPDLDEATVHKLLEALSQPPVVFVPPHNIVHNRHNNPSTREICTADRALDAFAIFERGAELAVQWPNVKLLADQYTALVKLAGSLPYLGRADSVSEARVAESWAPTAHGVWLPLDVASYVPDGGEVTTVLAPERPLNLNSLVARPVEVRKQGLSFPEGTRLLGYQRAEVASRRPSRMRVERRPVRAIRFDMTQRVRPRSTDALVYTDLLRRAALSELEKRRDNIQDTLLGGKTAAEIKAADHHAHAHYLPLIDGPELVGLLVWVPQRLAGDELAALLDVRRLWSPITDKWRARLRVADFGDVDDVAPELTGSSHSWQSVTPFVPSIRHLKKSWDRHRVMLEGMRRELRYRGVGDADFEITLLDGGRGFRRSRPSKPDTGGLASMIELRLNRPIIGPLALGHLSHFGLGLFQPSKD